MFFAFFLAGPEAVNASHVILLVCIFHFFVLNLLKSQLDVVVSRLLHKVLVLLHGRIASVLREVTSQFSAYWQVHCLVLRQFVTCIHSVLLLLAKAAVRAMGVSTSLTIGVLGVGLCTGWFLPPATQSGPVVSPEKASNCRCIFAHFNNFI